MKEGGRGGRLHSKKKGSISVSLKRGMDGEEATCVFTTAVKRKSERGVVKSTVIQLPVRGASLFRLFISGHELEKEGEKTA